MKLPSGLLLIAGPVIFVASTLHVVAAERAIEAQHGMVVTVSPQATDVGVTVLQHGGNAVDAAVAVAFALAVTWPAAGNIGGGGFMLVYPGVGQKPVCIEYREMAPAAATVSMLRDYTRMDGLRVCATPGTVAGLALAHRKYGKLPWRELTMPAVRLARDGIAVDEALAKSLNAVLCTIVNLVDFGMDVRQAIDGPRLHHQWFPDYAHFEGCSQPEYKTTLQRLSALGHRFDDKPAPQGDAHSIWIDPLRGHYFGAADKRICGKAAGY